MSAFQHVPMNRDDADAFVDLHHRHHGRTQGYKFAMGCVDEEGVLQGVAVVGRPVARALDDGWTLEVLRLCSLGGDNVCSFLYGRAWKAARALGYRRLVTYTQPSEGGASLRAAGWTVVAQAGGGPDWHCESRPRVSRSRQETLRWEVVA